MTKEELIEYIKRLGKYSTPLYRMWGAIGKLSDYINDPEITRTLEEYMGI